MAIFNDKKDRGFLGGLAKGALSTVGGVGSLGERALTDVTKALLPKRVEQRFNIQQPQQTTGERIQQAVKPVSPAETAGFVTEQIAEFLIPSSAIVKAQKLGTSLVSGTTKLAASGRVGIRSLIEAATVGGQSALQHGEFKQEEKTAALVGAVFPFAGGALGAIKKRLGTGLQSTGEALLERQIKPTLRGIEEGFDIGNIKKYGIAKGNLPEMLVNVENTIHGFYDEVTSLLKKGGEKANVNLNQVFVQTSKRLREDQAKLFGDIGGVNRILDKMKGEIQSIAGKNGEVDVMTAQLVKQAAGRKGSWIFGMADPDARAIEKAYTTFYQELKTTLETVGGPQIKQLNKQISDLIPISHELIRRIPIESRQNVLSLYDNMSLFASVFNPKALMVLGANRLSKNPRFANFLIRAGEKIEQRIPKTSVGQRFSGGADDVRAALKDPQIGASIKAFDDPRISELQSSWKRIEQRKGNVSNQVSIKQLEKAQKAIEDEILTILELGSRLKR